MPASTVKNYRKCVKMGFYIDQSGNDLHLTKINGFHSAVIVVNALDHST